MGLATDSIFIAALSESEDIMEAVGGRIYGTAIPLPDEDAENVNPPYIIVTFDSLQNGEQTKDDRYEGSYDKVAIGIEVVAGKLGGLHDLTQMVRDVILEYFRTNDTPVIDYDFSAQAIQFDSMKPCYWQVLIYQCEVNNSYYEQED
jgi:hypothetical protein